MLCDVKLQLTIVKILSALQACKIILILGCDVETITLHRQSRPNFILRSEPKSVGEQTDGRNRHAQHLWWRESREKHVPPRDVCGVRLEARLAIGN